MLCIHVHEILHVVCFFITEGGACILNERNTLCRMLEVMEHFPQHHGIVPFIFKPIYCNDSHLPNTCKMAVDFL